jgi:uncharacterized membrane protein HdeD (DUF308 family)
MPGRTELTHAVKVTGSAFIAAGVITVIVGLAAVFWPKETLLVLAILAGVNLFILGLVGLVEGLTGSASGSRVLSAVLGLIALIAGLVLIRRPGESLVVFVIVLGIWFVVSAVVAFVRAIFEPEGRGVRMVVALVEFAFGVLILSLPKPSLKTLAVLVGIAFAIRGIALIVGGVEMRREGKRAESQIATTEQTPAAV